jgi:hypothetical protein
MQVIGANDRPVVSDLSANADEDGTTVLGSFVVNDADTTDTHTFTITSQPSEGSDEGGQMTPKPVPNPIYICNFWF